MFGNYVVDHGVYKLTIQNVIKKDFEFMPGGTIASVVIHTMPP